MNQRIRTDWLLLAGFCLFLFFYGLGAFGLLGADEPRYAQVAREMLARRDWITPTLGGRPWLEKPVLYYWQAMLAYLLFGVSDWAARMPSAFDATLMVVGSYVFLRRRRPGFELDGALMLASAAGVVGFARAAATDMPLAAMFTLALLCWYAWWEAGSKLLLAGFYVFLALATLAKGPVAPLLAGAILVLFALAARDAHILLRTLWLPGMLLFFLAALPWYVAVQIHNPEFFRVFILEHNFARFGTNLYRHKQPFWFFLPVLLLGLIPWTIFVIAGAYETLRAWWTERRALFESGDALNLFLVLWLLTPVVFFSLSQSKLPGYILPSIPAGTLLVAEYVRRHASEEDGGRLAPATIMLHALLAAAPLVPAVLIQSVVLQRRLPTGEGLWVASALALLVAVAVAWTLFSKPGLRMLRFVSVIPALLALAAVIKLGAAPIDATLSARPIAAQIDALAPKPIPVAVFGVRRETEYGLAFYRNQVVLHYDPVPPVEEHLLVVQQGSESALARILGTRPAEFLGSDPHQHLDFYRVAASLPQ